MCAVNSNETSRRTMQQATRLDSRATILRTWPDVHTWKRMCIASFRVCQRDRCNLSDSGKTNSHL